MAGFTGDPFVRCLREERKISFIFVLFFYRFTFTLYSWCSVLRELFLLFFIFLASAPKEPENPCDPSPCGPNSQCRVIGTQPACSCLPNYIGRAPNCRPECTSNSECSSNLACVNEKCRDPCPGACATFAKCTVVNHNAVCSCLPGYIGDASQSCTLAPLPSKELKSNSWCSMFIFFISNLATERPRPPTPCSPSPCGPNAECREKNGAGACICSPGYFGDPYDSNRGCRRECDVNTDCVTTLACVGYKCVDPCPGTCGTYAECQTVNHIPICTCPAGFTGDPFFQCREIPVTRKIFINFMNYHSFNCWFFIFIQKHLEYQKILASLHLVVQTANVET